MSWLDLLALSAATPTRAGPPTRSAATGPGRQRALAGPLDHRAVDWLRDLVELRDRGLRQPLRGAARDRARLGRGARRAS